MLELIYYPQGYLILNIDKFQLINDYGLKTYFYDKEL